MATVAVGVPDTRVNAFLKDDKRIPEQAKGQSRGKGGGGLLVWWCLYWSSGGGKGWHLRDQQHVQAAVPSHGRAGGVWADPSHSACGHHFTLFLLFDQEKHPSHQCRGCSGGKQRVCAAQGRDYAVPRGSCVPVRML